MNEGARTKECKICYQEIDERAKKCPYCRHWQQKWHLVVSHPVTATTLMLLVVMGFYGLLMVGILPGGEDFAAYRDQFAVSESEMLFGEVDGESTVSVVGVVLNRSDITWEHIEIEVRFFDPEGKLIDTAGDMDVFDTIAAGGEKSFKAMVEPHLPKEQYASYKVLVRSAKDARRRF